MEDLVFYLKFGACWLFVGFVFSTILLARKNQEVLVRDLLTISLMSIGGFAWFLIILLDVLSSLYGKWKNVPLWESKKRRAERILFHKTRDHNEPQL